LRGASRSENFCKIEGGSEMAAVRGSEREGEREREREREGAGGNEEERTWPTRTKRLKGER